MGILDYTTPGLLGMFDGGGGGGASYGKAGKKQVNLNVLFPLLMQGMYASAALGNDPIEFLSQFKMDKGSFKDAKKSGGAEGFLHIGNSFFDVGALSKALPDLLQKQQDKQIADKQATADKLANTPLYAGIFGEAKGQYGDQFNADLDKAYTEMSGAALGQGAKSGFLLDPNKQAE